jgi:general stress protein 26
MITHGVVLTLATCLAAWSAVPPGQASSPAPAAPTRARIVEATRTILERARYATLVTLDEGGAPQGRVVDPFPPEGDDLVVWVATNGRSRKVGQIARDPRVTLVYFEPATASAVTLVGTAQLVRDPVEKARHWKDEWKAFYQDTHKGDDYVLIRVTPSRLEVVGEAYGMVNDPATWRPVILPLP